MFDDIGRNFLMNPQNGLKVSCLTFHTDIWHFIFVVLLCRSSFNDKLLCLDPAFHEGSSEQREGQGAV